MSLFTSALATIAIFAALLLLSRLSMIMQTSDRLLNEYGRLLAEARDRRRRELGEDPELFDEAPRDGA